MGVKDMMVGLARRTTGAHIYRILPRGLDLTHDIRNALPTYPIDVIFDVGANTGQSATRYLEVFPDAQVYSFEPVGETFLQLQRTLRGESRAHCVRLALGATEGTARMLVEPRSVMSRVIADPCVEATTEEVELSTVDAFGARSGIARISYLKVDVEGSDLEVLRGADSYLRDQRIGVVEVEASMNAENARQVQWPLFYELLTTYRYYLFGIYEQVTEWPTGRPHLRRANLAFISAALSTAYKQ